MQQGKKKKKTQKRSCCDTCALRFTRVRARLHARLSRLTYLHLLLRRCRCYFSGSSLQTLSCERRCQPFRLSLSEWERSRRSRAEQLEPASLDHAGFRSAAQTRAFLSSLNVYGEPSASPSQWSEIACESAVFFFKLDL